MKNIRTCIWDIWSIISDVTYVQLSTQTAGKIKWEDIFEEIWTGISLNCENTSHRDKQANKPTNVT